MESREGEGAGGGGPVGSPGERGEPYRLLFVCTGNTCRSPLAEGIARRAVARLGWSQVEVRSAGVAASAGAPASGGAISAAARHGLDLEAHRSTPLSSDLVAWADLVLTMSPSHTRWVEALGAPEKAALLTAFADEGASATDGVPDPVGGDLRAYERTFETLERLVDAVLARLEPMIAP